MVIYDEKCVINYCIVFFSTNSVFGTAQFPDYLIVENDTLPIFTNPLEQYFEIIGNRELPLHRTIMSTACWRGYIAYWELKNDSLFLKKITNCEEEDSIANNTVVRTMFGSDIVYADWFNGEIRIPEGKRVQYVHMGYASIYERDRFLTFKNGIKTKERVKSNAKIANEIAQRHREIEVSKKARDTIFYYVKNNINWEDSMINSVWMCDDTYILTFSKSGKIKSVNTEPILDSKWENWLYNTILLPCRRRIKRSLKGLDLSYLDLPDSSFKIKIDVFYDDESGELKFWEPL